MQKIVPVYNKGYFSEVYRLKKLVRERDHHKCRWCGAETKIVHHYQYDMFSNEIVPSGLMICLYQTCHDKIRTGWILGSIQTQELNSLYNARKLGLLAIAKKLKVKKEG